MSSIGKTHQTKIFRGGYSYWNANTLYAEETYEVFKDSKEMTYNFKAQLHSRVLTGELLKVEVDYICNKDMVAQKVKIQKNLGPKSSTEQYSYDRKKNVLNYQYVGNKKEEVSLNTPPIFHVATPVACTSTIFLQSKKFEQTGDNYYTIFSSMNQWDYIEAPKAKSTIVRRPNMQAETMMLNGTAVDAAHYVMYDGALTNAEDRHDAPVVNIYLSRYLAIPYSVKEGDLRIETKYLNAMDDF